ncbi:ArsR/SmtB family transcription factor [Mycobacteroides stephanolepidis]|uniref:ArsR/SmtB family transcription factor n=1 Tax=[Mycobacterium] stephanolepidis TaxID=1520670 RepID=UPI000BBB526B|nr:metalloregulator ArsR/SmtB family transcription factor [[Mycobacterium] stephanolepidis]
MKESTVDSCDLLCLDLPQAESIRESLPRPEWMESAAAGARALGDPTRLMIAMALLRGEELCVCDMAWVVGQGQGLVSHHLRQLKTAGMVFSRRQGRLVIYRLTERGRVLTETVVASVGTAASGKGDRHV